MNIRLLIVFISVKYFIVLCRNRRQINFQCREKEDCTAKLIKYDGYVVENHFVVTEDGYVIGMHRIPFSRTETSKNRLFQRRFNRQTTASSKSVTILLHCFMCSSSEFVVLGPDFALAYKLADKGHDVWIINTRGNKYSKAHVTLPASSREFWQYSWHEQGMYDLPAGIDYILNLTNQSMVNIVAFSMGVSQTFVLLSQKPQYNQKIRTLSAIAPAIYIGHSQGSFVNFPAGFSIFAIELSAFSGMLEVGHPILGLKKIFSSFCTPNIFMTGICDRIMTLTGAKNNGNIDRRLLPFYYQFFPESTSMRTFVHFRQIHETGNFQMYSYGWRNNPEIYGSIYPPQYNLTKITVPVNLFWAQTDEFTPVMDVKKLLKVLPNIVSTYEVPFKRFSHMDFVWSKKAEVVYDAVLEKLK